MLQLRSFEKRLKVLTSTPLNHEKTIIRKDSKKLAFNFRGERNQKNQSTMIHQLKQKIEKIKSTLVPILEPKTKMTFSFSHLSFSETLHVDVRSVKKVYGEKVLFENVSLHLSKGDRCIITGSNGVGRSTFLKIIADIESADAGSVALSPDVGMVYLDQEKTSLDLKKSPYTFLSDRAKKKEIEFDCIDFLEQFGIFYAQDQMGPLQHASIGCRRKVQLAEIVLSGCNVLLLDEPTHHIDFLGLETIEKQLMVFPGIIIAISHDKKFNQKIGKLKLNLDEKAGIKVF